MDRGILEAMRTMNASRFKEQVPADSDCASLIGSMRGKIEIRGDILSTGLDWDAES